MENQLKTQLETIKNYIENYGPRYEYLEIMYNIADIAINQGKLIDFGLEVTLKVKQHIEKLMLDTVGKDIWAVIEYCREQSATMNEVELYWNTIKLESYYLLESFIEYMEKKRPLTKKFYYPRKKTLQIVVNDLQDLESGYIRFYGLSMPSRVGKAIAYDTPVLTRSGWKKHGELTILDEVIGLDGEFKKILAIHNPCRMEYKVTFSDGEQIICHGNHEWRVHCRPNDKIKDVETKTMYEDYIMSDGRKKYSIPHKQVLYGSHKDLWVDPYTLGAWLGDGRNTNPDICGAESDYAVVQKILDAGYELAWDTKHKTTGVRYYGFKGLRQGLQHYGMCHSRETTFKHIPSEYLVASIEQRLELLAGLLDTDGSLRKDEHRYSFTTNEPILRDDFMSLVNTFGWRTCVVRYESGVSSSGIYANKPYWVVSFNPTMYIPCQLERKQLNVFSKQRKVTIEKIEKINVPIGGNCITVEDEIYCVGKTLKPTHNSTICIFFLAWIALRKPNSHSAMGGHSGILAKGFYKELMNLFTTEEYTFAELFEYWHPGCVVLRDKSADEFTITLDQPDRFATITCRGIDGTWTGAVDVSRDGYLYVDDLVRDREHSLSPLRMESTFQEYLNKMVDRKNDGAKELMVGTLWNVLDPLNRIREQYEGNPEYRFRKIPALDENDESNFDYVFNGFSTEYYREMRSRLDKAEWMAKFQQQPFVREGLLFPSEELKYFDGNIPTERKSVVAICDPAFGGADSLSMPICYIDADDKKYIIDWVHKQGTQAVTVPIIVDKIVAHYITELHIEQNSGGKLLTDSIKAEMQRRDVRHCKIVPYYASTKMPKDEKIKAYSDWVKENFMFLMPNSAFSMLEDIEYKRNEQYQKAMDELSMYTSEGKNFHDDAPDSITQFAIVLGKKQKQTVVLDGFI